MNFRRFLLTTTACAALLAPSLGMAGDPGLGTYEEAVAQHQKGHWAEAYGRFMALANAGDADAARTALFMLRNGPQLYNTYWDAMPFEERRWEQLAASSQGRRAPAFEPIAYR